jgi:hypothetical protein
MRLSAKVIATVASVVLLVSAFNLCAEEAVTAASADDKAVDLSAGVAGPYAPMLEPSMSAAMPYARGLNLGVPRFELFAGYSYLRAVPTLAAGNRLVWMNGGSTSLAFNVNRYLGLVGDFGAYTNSEVRFTGAYTSTVDVNNSDVAAYSYLFGPRLSFRKHDRFTPFAQALFGRVQAGQVSLTNCTVNCVLLLSQGSFGMTAGAGLDLRVHRHIAIRVVQAEYLMTRFPSSITGTTATQNDMRLSAGIVFRFGGNPHVAERQPVSYSCAVNPATAFIGETITVSGDATNLDPTKTAVYTWSADGGVLTGTSSTATIDTTQAAAGTYTVKGHVSEGNRPGENADCTAPYTVKALEPPTVSCSADPSTLISGSASAITATGVSPQNRPLTYSYSSTAGSVSGTGSTATLNTSGALTGVIAVTCNVADDKGQTASATTSVTVEVPVAEPKPQASDLCAVHFDRDARRPVRVDNEGKACLDEVALELMRNSDARLAMVGNAAGGENDGKKLAAQRASNTKAYLVGEKGIDASRITVYTGTQDGRVVSTTLIPAGATFDSASDTPVP